MFIWRKTHDRLMQDLRDRLSDSEASRAYERSLQEERINDLRRLVFVPRSEPARESYEVDAVISCSEKPVEQSEAERNAFLTGERELDLLVSGNYSEDLLN